MGLLFLELSMISSIFLETTRESFLVTYSGEYSTVGVPIACKDIVDVQMSQCRAEWDCKCQDVANNTYYCIRKIAESENSIFCQFEDDEGFIEAYDLIEDPYQLNNIFLDANEDSIIQKEHIMESLENTKNFIQDIQDNSDKVNDEFRNIAIVHYIKQLFFYVIQKMGI